jgi:beta-glucosidase
MASDVTTLAEAAYQDPTRPIEARVEDLLGRLSLEEKVALMAGASAFRLEAIERLGVPALGMTDGPTGVRSNTGQMATVFPVAVALAATFNPDLTREVAAAIAREAIALGEQVVLAPTINIVRTPLWGRNFETYSEDPYLTAELAIGFVEGLQGEGIGASLKHYAANNQEERRMDVSVEIDERTLREIYLSAFEATVKAANPWTVMASYNKLRGIYASENPHLLQDILKGEWAYDGAVVSDWGAVHSTVPAANGGLDLEMPGPPVYFGAKLLAAVKAGQVAETRIEDAARRLVRLILRTGLLDGTKRDGELRSDRHRQIARRAAQERGAGGHRPAQERQRPAAARRGDHQDPGRGRAECQLHPAAGRRQLPRLYRPVADATGEPWRAPAKGQADLCPGWRRRARAAPGPGAHVQSDRGP